MGKGQKKYKLFCIAILTIFLTTCGQTEMNVHTAEEETDKNIVEESIQNMIWDVLATCRMLREQRAMYIDENQIWDSAHITEEEEDSDGAHTAEEEEDSDGAHTAEKEEVSDNPYRNLSETYSGPWKEALYETLRGTEEIAVEEITYTYEVSDGWRTAHYLALIPHFPEAKEDKVLQKIQQYCEEDLILTEEQKAAYEEYAGQEVFMGGQTEDTFWRAYRQEGFITVIFEYYHNWGRGTSDPYADVFWADTGECVSFDELFGGKEAELEQILKESGRVIPLGCIMEEWESWEFAADDSGVHLSEMSLPYQRDRCFCPTPYGMVFIYSTGEISARAAGTVLIFIDWSSLEEIYDF